MKEILKRNATPIPRSIGFEFPDDVSAHWIPGEPELSAMMNGASLTMPFLEPFLIKTVNEAMKFTDDAAIAREGKAFNTQEQFHFRTHRRFNEVIKSKGYPELQAVEAYMTDWYQRLQQKPLQARVAYTAGFESMTLGVTKWLIEHRVELFANADPRVASFILWHMVEETEHKCVAFDVYQALYGSSPTAWWHRMIGVFHGSLDVVRLSMRGYKVILRKDGLWSNLRSRLRLAVHLGRATRHIAPFLLRAALPGHTPRSESDPQWVLDWLAGHADAEDGYVPLVDTRHPDMPVPFTATHRLSLQAAA